jgi:hypothetical protein
MHENDVLIQGIATKFLSDFCDLYFLYEFPKMGNA